MLSAFFDVPYAVPIFLVSLGTGLRICVSGKGLTDNFRQTIYRVLTLGSSLALAALGILCSGAAFKYRNGEGDIHLLIPGIICVGFFVTILALEYNFNDPCKESPCFIEISRETLIDTWLGLVLPNFLGLWAISIAILAVKGG